MRTDDTRQRILEAARGLFGRFGLRKTSVAEVAKAAGMAKGSLYYYFPGKEQLFEAVVKEELANLWDTIRKSIEAVVDPKERIRVFVLSRMRRLKELANAYAALHEEYLEQLGFVERIREDAVQQEVEALAAILKEGVTMGIFSVSDVDLTAYAIVVALKGLEYPWAMQMSEEKIEQNLDALLVVLFEGILAR